MLPLISVIIPFYNRADKIDKAIQSVFNQTLKEFELILVDDGSTDSADIIQKYDDHRIKYLKHSQNKGGAAARNTGIKNASGNYIAFLDSDDEWLPAKLEKQVQLFDSLNDPSLVAVGCGRFIHSFSNGKSNLKISSSGYFFGNIYDKLRKGYSFPGLQFWPGSTSSIIIKKEGFEKVGLFDESLKAAQEHDLYLRLSEHFKFAAVPEPLLTMYTDASNRISNSNQSQIIGKLQFLQKHDSEIPQISPLRGNFYYHIGLNYYKKNDKKLARRYLFKAVISWPYKAKYWYNFIKHFL